MTHRDLVWAFISLFLFYTLGYFEGVRAGRRAAAREEERKRKAGW